MLKKLFLPLFLFAFGLTKAQILFSDKFNSLSLQTYTTLYSTSNYTTVPTGYTLVDDGFKNNVGSPQAPNKPFNVASLKTSGWAVGYNTAAKDTFLVSTSWLDTTAAVNRYAVTPPVSAITASTVLYWDAMAPDNVYRDGYDVFVTNNTAGTLTAASFNVSDKIFTLADASVGGGGEKSQWTKHGVSLGIYAGQNLRIAFRNTSKQMYQLWIDNISVENVANAVDAEISVGQDIYKYNTVNTNGNVNFRITNKGFQTITALTLNYSVIGLSNVTQAFSMAQSLTPNAFGDFTFSTPYNIATPGYYKIKTWVTFVNGVTDQNHLNDTITSYVSIMATAPQKNVLVEQFVSAYDGYTPYGQDTLKALSSSSVITVNIHDADSLKNLATAPLISTYRQNNSSALIDRNYFFDLNSVAVDRLVYNTRINLRKPAIVPASVTITNKNYNSLTREITFTVNATFNAEVRGDYRINAYITEDNVYGPVTDTTYNGWNQLNFMHNVPWSKYYLKGSYSAAANGYVLAPKDYMHQKVLTAAPDGVYGNAGVIPTLGGTTAQTYSTAYSYTLPVATNTNTFRYNPDNIFIVGMVVEYNTDKNYRAVLNCIQDKLTANPEAVFVKEFSNANNLFSVFPNPTYGFLNILIPQNSFAKQPRIKVLDVLGQEVYSQQTDFTFGLIQINLDHLANGSYFIILEDGLSKCTKKLVITH